MITCPIKNVDLSKYTFYIISKQMSCNADHLSALTASYSIISKAVLNLARYLHYRLKNIIYNQMTHSVYLNCVYNIYISFN